MYVYIYSRFIDIYIMMYIYIYTFINYMEGFLSLGKHKKHFMVYGRPFGGTLLGTGWDFGGENPAWLVYI